MTTMGFINQYIKGYSLHSAGSAPKTLVNNFSCQTHSFEDLRSFIGLKGGDAHLGHDLKHPFGYSFLVGCNKRLLTGIIFTQQFFFVSLP